jgi:cytochrome c-type biogenesis protein
MHPTRPRIPALIIASLVMLIVAQPVSGLVQIEYFHQQGCINCMKTDPIIDNIRVQYGNRVAIKSIEIDDRAGIRLLMSYGVTEIPIVAINRNKILTYNEITPERLDAEIRLAESGAYPIPEKRKTIFENDAFPVLFAFILGLMTGLSPCLLGSLVVLIAVAGNPMAAGRKARYFPLIFGMGILIAYLIASAGILFAGVAFRPDAGTRLVVNTVAGVLSIMIGVLQLGLLSLPDRIGRHIPALVSRFRTIPGIFLLGFIFAILFAPCAIAPFLVLIETILLGNTVAPVAMIGAFSAGILLPFAFLTLLRSSIPAERLLKYAGLVQKLGGILLVGFGIWLIILA